MGLRFFRRKRLAPGLKLNFSKSGISTSLGTKGFWFTIGSRGIRKTIGIPGTGIYYTKLSGWGGKSKSSKVREEKFSKAQQANQTDLLKERLTLGFFKRLIVPPEEQAFIDGLREYIFGSKSSAIEYLKKSPHLADGAFLAGLLLLKNKELDQAEHYLLLALDQSKSLGKHFDKFGIEPTIILPITEEFGAKITPSPVGIKLALVELYQHKGEIKKSIELLKELHRLYPDDLVVKLSLIELLHQSFPTNKKIAQRIVKITSDITENTSPIHTAILLYKARA